MLYEVITAVIVKAEHSEQGANPRFIVSSLEGKDQDIYDKIYCARGEMENRIKESRMRDNCLAHARVPNVGGPINGESCSVPWLMCLSNTSALV